MSSIESPTWTSNAVLLWALRAIQYILSIITLGLTANVVKFFSGSSTTGYAVAVSVISLVYVVSVFTLAFCSPGCFCLGALLIAEVVVMILWFCAFIAMAAAWGPGNCDALNGVGAFYDGNLIYFSDAVTPCKCAKAAIAMCALAWLLFVITCSLLVWNIGLPLARNHTATSWWETLGSRGLAVHKATALTLVSSRSYNSDIETAAYKEEETTLGNSHAEQTLNEKTYGYGQADLAVDISAAPEAPAAAVLSTGPEASFVSDSDNGPLGGTALRRS